MTKKPKKRKKKKTQIIYIEDYYLNMIKELIEAPVEVGGGITIDKKKKKIIEIVIFPSESSTSIIFTKNYDIEFHTHPSDKNNKLDVLMSKTPSAGDIAAVYTGGAEEIVIARGYIFKIGIKDRDLIRKTKYNITREANKKGKKFPRDFDKYYAFFKKIDRQVTKEAKRKSNTQEWVIRNHLILWKKELKKYGIEIVRIKLMGAEFAVH